METITVAAKEVLNINGLAITNTFIWTLLISVTLLIFLIALMHRPKIVPGKAQNFVEFILEIFKFLRFINWLPPNNAQNFPACHDFLLILCCNLMELIPGLGVISFLRSPSSDLNFTVALALIAIIFINYSAIKKLGPFSYLSKFFNFKNPIQFFVGLLELISEFAKIVSLSMRLFGNMFAGEALLIVISSLVVWLVPLPFLALEVLIGFIQALVFATLTVVFYTIATTLNHENV